MFSWFKKVLSDYQLPVAENIITRSEVDRQFEDRYSRINHEVKTGLEIVRKLPKSVTIFGSARLSPDHKSYKDAFEIARRLSDHGYAVISGGGHGIMGAANCGAKAGQNGKSIGFNIILPHEQSLNTCTDQSLEFHYFFSRKLSLTFSGEAYIYFPGGFGTFDELFEILTLVQTGKIEPVPIILFGSEFWNPVDNLLKSLMAETFNTIDINDTHLYKITDSIDEVIQIVDAAPMRKE